jgi:deoxyribose-phosphate aldolase
LLRLAVGSDLGVKASGGIRTAEVALQMIAAGASRIGTSAADAMAAALGPAAEPLERLLRPYLSGEPPAADGA